MKIPGLFTKTAKYHRFEYKPRYYDPKKEEHEEREARIRREIAMEQGEIPAENNPYDHRVRMKGAFQSARKRGASTSDEPNYAIMRLGILLLIALFLIGFFQWGGKVVYALFLIFPIWIYFRFFKKNKTEG
jgi:hypothetical protein